MKRLIISFVAILTIGLPFSVSAESDIVGELVPADNYVSALNVVPQQCDMSINWWSTLVLHSDADSRYRLSTVTITLPEGQTDCLYSYKIRHNYLSWYFTSNVPLTCLEHDVIMIECFGIAGKTITISFFMDGLPDELIGTYAEDWLQGEYFGWLIRGWRSFMPYVDG